MSERNLFAFCVTPVKEIRWVVPREDNTSSPAIYTWLKGDEALAVQKDFEEWQQKAKENREREEARLQEKREKESEEYTESFVRLFTIQSK